LICLTINLKLTIHQSNVCANKTVNGISYNTYSAKLDVLGAAVLPDLNSYYPRVLSLDIPELPIGYDIGSGYATVKSSYHSVVVVNLSGEVHVLYRGQILNSKNKPVQLKAGRMTLISTSEKLSKLFFTNRTGFFQVNGLMPGKYLLYLIGDPLNAKTVKIKVGSKGVVNDDEIAF